MSSALALRPADDSVGPVPPATPNRPDWTDEAVLAGAKAIADGPLSAAAAEIDRGTYPLEILGRLGGAGALAVHLDRHGGASASRWLPCRRPAGPAAPPAS